MNEENGDGFQNSRFVDLFEEENLVRSLMEVSPEKWRAYGFNSFYTDFEGFRAYLGLHSIGKVEESAEVYSLFFSHHGKEKPRVFTGEHIERLYKKINEELEERKIVRVRISCENFKSV